MRKILGILASMCLCSCVFAGIKTDSRLLELESAYAPEDTQLDLNIKSAAIRRYLDEKLVEIESLINNRFVERGQNDLRTEFDQSCELWRQYRDRFVNVWGRTYEGGSIRPFIENGAWSEITKTRILELESFSEER